MKYKVAPGVVETDVHSEAVKSYTKLPCSCGYDPVVAPVFQPMDPPIISGYICGCGRCYKLSDKANDPIGAIINWNSDRKLGHIK